MTAARHFNGQQWVPGERQNQVRSLPGTTQDIEQHENNCELANYKCYFQRKGRLVNGGYGAEEKLRPRWIWARQIRVVQVAGFRGMQPLRGRIAGNDKIGVVAEPLQAAIPNISMNIIIGARGQPKKFNVPHSRQDEPNDDNASGKSLAWRKTHGSPRGTRCPQASKRP